LEGRKIEPAEVLSRSVDEAGKPELQRQRLADRSHLKPNEGTWRSLKNGLTGGSRFDKSFKLFTTIFYGGFAVTMLAVGAPFLATAFAGFLAANLYAFSDEWGLDAFIEHYAVRFLLARTNSLPWDLIAFLDQASERLFLHKVGGSYIFAHRLLLDYFAE
jgi:hypothetical protein